MRRPRRGRRRGIYIESQSGVLVLVGYRELVALSAPCDEKFLEDKTIDHLQQFMLELGKGFTFVGRQLRFSLGVNHFRPDLVFYNRFTRSFFVMDLKLGKVTNRDLGQMQTSVHHYDRNVKLPEENPTIGILLSSRKVDDAVVELTLPESCAGRVCPRRATTSKLPNGNGPNWASDDDVVYPLHNNDIIPQG